MGMEHRPLGGKVALVTGAGSDIGLGRAMVEAMVRAGACVAMMDVNKGALEATFDEVQKMGGKDAVTPVVGDISSPEEAERAVQETIKRLGGLHILVNNAGVTPAGLGRGLKLGARFTEIPPDVWARVISVNVNGAFHMTRAAVDHLVDQGWGRIISVTTSLDTMLHAGGAPYGPSKAAHEAFIAIIAKELKDTGVTANVLVPGGSAATHLSGPDRENTGKIPPQVMQLPVLWLASTASDGFTGRRIMANQWDETLPIEQRLERASSPAAWPQLGRNEQPASG